ncbi:MAG TPA: DUF4386 domain-containing protein [Terriglobales bacterium]|nr:DUF4386 domain-containing protein [Terriglobales bacterium]
MTRTTNARLAGTAFLAYIVTGIAEMMLFGNAARGIDIAGKFANLAQHVTTVRVCALLQLLTFFDAATLAVTLYALTRDEDTDLAVLALACRLAEGVLGAVAATGTMRLASVAATSSGGGPEGTIATTFGHSLLSQSGSSGLIAGVCFAVGSTIFAYLFLRARSIPVALAWLGLLASLLLVATLPVQLAGLLPSGLAWPIWMPMLIFEITLAFWLLWKAELVAVTAEAA